MQLVSHEYFKSEYFDLVWMCKIDVEINKDDSLVKLHCHNKEQAINVKKSTLNAIYLFKFYEFNPIA